MKFLNSNEEYNQHLNLPSSILPNIKILTNFIASSKSYLSHVVKPIVSKNQYPTRFQYRPDVNQGFDKLVWVDGW